MKKNFNRELESKICKCMFSLLSGSVSGSLLDTSWVYFRARGLVAPEELGFGALDSPKGNTSRCLGRLAIKTDTAFTTSTPAPAQTK